VSDTPRTDAAAIRCACSTYVVPSEFARELERENAALRADLLIEEERSIYWRDNEGRAMAENAALREDKQRLDWLQNGGSSEVDDLLYEMNVDVDFDVRAAIDAARKEKP